MKNSKETIVKKTISILVRIVIEDADLNGYYTLLELASMITDYFMDEFCGKNYLVQPDKIESNWNEDATTGDYWGWDMLIPCELPIIPMGNHMKRIGR
ncbi:MAG: hypothetical protein LBT51_01240 [Fusobacteriaceae bacterium]|jgi:hypothetical protein|nr:hypothetical protein [Fusobacteriaceae bacterium]